MWDESKDDEYADGCGDMQARRAELAEPALHIAEQVFDAAFLAQKFAEKNGYGKIMKCRNCDKIEPRGCGKTCCTVDKKVINDFDSECPIDKDNKTNGQNNGSVFRVPVETSTSA